MTWLNNLRFRMLSNSMAAVSCCLYTNAHYAHLCDRFDSGHLNHSIYWENLAPKSQGGGELPKGALLSAIQKEFGSMDNFIEKFNTIAAGVQGSGWCWLGYNKAAQRVEIATSGNQDTLQGLVPLLVIDVWEHAYYLQYKNVRADYLKKVWDVVNWKTVAERFAEAQH